MRRIAIFMSVAIAASLGTSSARAEADPPPAELWRQQTSRPNLAVTVPDIAGRRRKIMYVNIDGYAVTEGDIALGTVSDVKSGKIHLPGVVPVDVPPPVLPKSSDGSRGGGAARCDRTPAGAGTASAAALWQSRQVPYVFDSGLPQSVRNTVMKAMADFSAGTCIRFLRQTTETAYLRVFSGTGCYSMVGRTGSRQDLSLGPGCDYKGTAIHELMHAVGFYHEHNRSDRDEAVTVNLDNVKPAYQSQFHKIGPADNRLLGGFDQDSVMIYGNKAFSANGQDTLVAKNGRPLTDPYHKTGFSPSDVAGVRSLYGC
jgi:hypothetical protein